MQSAKEILKTFLTEAREKMGFAEIYLDSATPILQELNQDHAEEVIRVRAELTALTQRLSNLETYLK